VRIKSIDHEFNVDGVKKLDGVGPCGAIPTNFLKQTDNCKKKIKRKNTDVTTIDF